MICSEGVWLKGRLKVVSDVKSVLNSLLVVGCMKVKCSGKVRK